MSSLVISGTTVIQCYDYFSWLIMILKHDYYFTSLNETLHFYTAFFYWSSNFKGTNLLYNYNLKLVLRNRTVIFMSLSLNFGLRVASQIKISGQWLFLETSISHVPAYARLPTTNKYMLTSLQSITSCVLL